MKEANRYVTARCVWYTAAIGLVLGVATAGLTAQSDRAQPPGPGLVSPQLEFDVARVKPSSMGPRDRSSIAWPPGAFLATNLTLGRLIAAAYAPDFQSDYAFERTRLVGGPSQLLTARFDIEARRSGNSAREAQLMLQALLMKRFGLRTRTERRMVPAYVLTVARPGQLGPELRPSSYDCWSLLSELAAKGQKTTDVKPSPRDAKGRSLCWGDRAPFREKFAGPIAVLIQRLQGFVDRPLIDQTELAGTFEWALNFDVELNSSFDRPPSLFTALQEQLGLRAESKVTALDMVVIEDVALPTPD